jgi:hypothetical protein
MVLSVDLRALCIFGKHSTTEIHFQSLLKIFCYVVSLFKDLVGEMLTILL